MNTKYLLNCLFLSCHIILALLISACNNELETIDSAKKQAVSAGNDDINILQSLGFDTSDITEMDTYYLIEGDIMFEKSGLSSYDKVQTRQAYHTTGLIGHPKQRMITVGVDSSIPISGVDNWREEIQEAINLWNPLSNLKMTYTSEVNPDILIRSDAIDPTPLDDYVIAAASWPTNGQPGSSIRINLDYYNNKTIPRLQKIYNMVHELGHCFGLKHTNWKSIGESEANHIDGTPISDPNSIMNGGTAEYQWNGFSEGDKEAIKRLYPFFKGEFNNFPDNIKHFGIDQFLISISCSHPIVSYTNWGVTAGVLVSANGNSATIILGSPVTSSVSVNVTTIYGEKYYISKQYLTQVTTQRLLN